MDKQLNAETIGSLQGRFDDLDHGELIKLNQLIEAQTVIEDPFHYSILQRSYARLGDDEQSIKYGKKALLLRHRDGLRASIEFNADTKKSHSNSLVVAYSLFGNKTLYLIPLLDSIKSLQRLFSFVNIVVYHDESVPLPFLNILRDNSVVLMRQNGTDLSFGPFWRFKAVNDFPNDKIWFRDADSVVTQREAQIIFKFYSDQQAVLWCIRDVPAHTFPLMAGMFGLNVNCQDSVSSLFPKTVKTRIDDQVFLAQSFWAKFYQDAVNFDCFYPNAIPETKYSRHVWPRDLDPRLHIGSKALFLSKAWLRNRFAKLKIVCSPSDEKWLRNRISEDGS